MNQKIKQKWVQALRSGNYKQGFNTLRKEDTFCCLGVLCDLHQKETHQGVWTFDSENQEYLYSISEEDSDAEVLPQAVIKWAELNTASPRVVYNGIKELTELNDIEKIPFTQLSYLIERKIQ